MKQYRIRQGKMVEVSPQTDLSLEGFTYKKKSSLLDKVSQVLLFGKIV